MLDILLIPQAVGLVMKGIDDSIKVLDWTENLKKNSKFRPLSIQPVLLPPVPSDLTMPLCACKN